MTRILRRRRVRGKRGDVRKSLFLHPRTSTSHLAMKVYSHTITSLKACLAGVLFLSSCSLLFEAVDITSRRANKVENGELVEGDGFVIKCPQAGLYLARTPPTPGGVVFRPVEPLADGLVFFVTPFHAPTARSLSEALSLWNARVVKRGMTVQVLRTEQTSFAGRQALRAEMELPRGQFGNVSSTLIVRRDSDYLILCCGESYFGPAQREMSLKQTVRDLAKL